MDKSGFGDVHYFAVVNPEGMIAVAFIAQAVVPNVFFVAWAAPQDRKRTWTESLEDAWHFLHEAFGEDVQYRELAPARFREFLATLRPRPQVACPPYAQGVCRLPHGSTVTCRGGTTSGPPKPVPMLAPAKRSVQPCTVPVQAPESAYVAPEPVCPRPEPEPVYVPPSFPVFDVESLPQTPPLEKWRAPRRSTKRKRR